MNEELIIKEYLNGASSLDLAKKYDTYQNKIIRTLKKHGIKPRSKSEAQKLALELGKSEHPTAGRTMAPESREKQSESQAQRWKKMSKNERESFRKGAKKRWEAKSDSEKQAMLSKAGLALQKASKEGSKAELFLCKALHDLGYVVQQHNTSLIPGNYELDIFLPELKTVIEIDGPQHFLPIFGQEALDKHIKFDTIKNGLIIKEGFRLIRVKYLVKHSSQKTNRQLLELVRKALNKKGKLIEVEIND